MDVVNKFTSKKEMEKGIGLTHSFLLFIAHCLAPGSFPGIHNSRPKPCCQGAHIVIRKQIHQYLVVISAIKKKEKRIWG